MGIWFAKLWRKLYRIQELKICMIGLDNAGKTTILYRLHLGDVVVTTPTIGSNVEQVKCRNLLFQVWDLGGQDSLREAWQTYFVNTQAVIFVIDSCDRERFDLARKELLRVLRFENLSKAVILVFANKQDMKQAASAAEISESLALHDIKTHSWTIQPCSGVTGEGLQDGMEWLADHVKTSG
ncbi:ADP-ribosylation factor-like protein 5B [Galdieria sulphuraria]|uniref:ADP-ribosylation factor n=1 Tax=Galdieria sulphuraria TaxID=130081 RepID=M2W1U8_GALSU|nr:ADP-ribosylation factor [Galdieria sulphuraria]EME29656.1 ADP-ribosylation factor [Galdieria sulphuraria]GJD12193.1 ADP-ribosylation factor-like protein 5B [Galdieria sulphuraria]|eukprot:XP_005706176.1 ADP-ribosylation factor [Galdieria sulphuraria]